MEKCLVLFSGGLDSRLVVKIMQDRGYDVLALHFKLPFIKHDERQLLDYAEKRNFRLKIIDVSKGDLLQEYLKIIKEAKHGRGSSMNPCIDCKIFMYRKAKEIADSLGIKKIVSGDVEGQRPMSQMPNKLKLIEDEAGLNGRMIRPLVNLGINGRQRSQQIILANKFGITYPSPGGGCLLCEKYLKCRFENLLRRGLTDKEIPLINIGRHFIIDNIWIIIGRNEEENNFLENAGIGDFIFPSFVGPSALILDKYGSKIKVFVEELIYVYSKKGKIEDREKFDKWKV